VTAREGGMPATRPWGRRLSDAVRAAIERGDLAAARRLALEGDGEARSLDKEYALMYRGLGITLRVIVGLLAETVGRAGGDADRAAATALLRRFRREMADLAAGAYRAPQARPAVEELGRLAGPAGGPHEEAERTAGFLRAGEALFAREQARLAAEAVRALEAGDGARARTLVDDKERGQYLPLHDRIIRFMAESFGLVLRRFGPDELLRFHLATAGGQRAGFDKWEGMGAEEFARAAAFLLRQHMGEVEVREDDEKFTIEQAPCGSGGRLRLLGAYEGPGALPMVAGPGALTLDAPSMPVYCSHCPVWNGLAPVRWYGRPHWVFDRPARADGACTLHIYKRRDGAPREYTERLGAAPAHRAAEEAGDAGG
jgi:hypothetical protein